MNRQANGTHWTREQLLLVMNLYCRIPFGRQHSRAPEVVELAARLGRTPGSVAMKLNNFTSLDPEEALRGVKGLPSASNLDKQVWAEFQNNWEEMAAESESLWQSVVAKGLPLEEHGKVEPTERKERSHKPKIIVLPQDVHQGPTEGERTVKVRYAQDFFRRAVLAAYNIRCCISGNPVPELLIASHILPWSEYPGQRTNPRNGLCLSRLHDAAFDNHLLTLDQDYRVVLSKSLREYLPNESLQANFLAYEGKRISLPEKFLPDAAYLTIHRENLCE